MDRRKFIGGTFAAGILASLGISLDATAGYIYAPDINEVVIDSGDILNIRVFFNQFDLNLSSKFDEAAEAFLKDPNIWTQFDVKIALIHSMLANKEHSVLKDGLFEGMMNRIKSDFEKYCNHPTLLDK